MKKLLILSLLAFTFTANAQLFDFGIKGGANFPNLKIDENTSVSDINIDNGTGFHFGGVARINLVLFYIQPELLYTNTKSNYSFKTNGTDYNSMYHMQRIDVPIMAGLKLGPVGIFVGPIASFNISSPDEIFDNGYKSATWGYQAGLGVKFFDVLAEVKYEGPFGDATTSAQVAGATIPLDSRTGMWILSFGYFFGKD